MSWPRGILFDLDGTLVDSAADMAAALNHVLMQDGYPELGVAEVTAMIGGGIPKLIERALTAHGAEAGDQQASAIYPRYREAYIPRAVEKTRLFPGAEEVLRECAARGSRLGICTNKPEEISRVILSALGVEACFDTVIGGDTLAVKKPDPAPVLEGLSRLDCSPVEGLMIGDSAADANAARDAGVRTILVTFGYSIEPVQDLCNQGIVDTFSDLIGAIEQLPEAEQQGRTSPQRLAQT